jgi:hypothetical protein
MAGYLGSKPVLLSTTAATVGGDASIGGDLTVDTSTLYVDSTNNRVGVGTTSPASLLDTASSGEVIGTIRSTSTSGARQATLRLNVQSTGGDDPAGKVQFTYGTGYSVAGSIEMTHTNPNMKFLTGTTERMRIDSSGNVGIGTLSPENFAGFTTQTINGSTGSVLAMQAGGVGNTARFVKSASLFSMEAIAAIPILFATNNTERMRIDASGNVGIGVSSVSGVKMDVLATVSDNLVARFENNHATGSYGISVKAGDDSGNYAADFANKSGTSLMRIRGDGNVGIGTSSPFYALQVNRTPSVSGYDGISLEDSGNVIGLFKTGSSYTFGSVGSGQAWIYSNTSDLNITSDGSGIIKFQGENAAERMRIDSSGNVGIGTSSPGNKLSLLDASGPCVLDMAGSNGAGSYGYATISTVLGSSGSGYGVLTIGTSNAGTVTERMRIDSSGDVRIGTGNGSNTVGPRFYGGGSTGSNGIEMRPEGDGSNSYKIWTSVNNTAARSHIAFFNPNGLVGRIETNGSATSYFTSSDYRLKEDVQPMVDATDRVLALNPVNFAWKADGSRVDGFLAHEAQEVVPESVQCTKDAMRDEEYEVTPAVYDQEGNLVSEAVMGTRKFLTIRASTRASWCHC